MPPKSLIDPVSASDAGAVASRRGQKYQDHVAASFVIEMLNSPAILQVECETADDITVRWIIDGKKANEYVQVKTTDGDKKWTVTDLVSRTDGRAGTSIAERSLDCDRYEEEPLFRLVTIREPYGNLASFKISRESRANIPDVIAAAVRSFSAKHPSFKSKNGRSLIDWANRLYWQVEQNIERLIERNQLALLKLAGRDGERPTYNEINTTYERLLNVVIDAGDASRVSTPDEKCIPRDAALKWWHAQIGEYMATSRAILKVYRIKTDEFFSNFCKIDEPMLNRALSAFDAEYDGGEWRRQELIDYLIDWIPEVVLPPVTLATFDHLSARTVLAKAIEECDSHGQLTPQALLSDLMLHAILRHHHKSEPIACKIFHLTAGFLTFTSAHIITDPQGDQLWLGQTRIATADDRDSILTAISQILRSSLEKEVLKRERKAIIQLRHSVHLSHHDLGRSMHPNGKVDDLLSVLHIPILIAYDSDVLSKGYVDDYLNGITEEAKEIYDSLKRNLEPEFRDMRIHIFLVPIECAKSLAISFESTLRSVR
ncbi:Hachiman antiphage defense system protein HamA [Azospirillum sp. TSH64]|uniref:HamA C-terminal domain-containing protein n=1 Tax=Azospirillum sp. TSH64 TaxID=652740 RepID=UPI000D68AA28|nr:Hachiman antiphage defense system protein HamA [Azospirillum sp. TSH64]